MKKSMIFFVFFVLLAGCSTVRKIDHYKISLQENNPYQKNYEQGLAFVNNSICVWAIEGISNDAEIVSIGPEFLPILPIGILISKPQPGYFQLMVWLVPNRRSDGMSFDSSKLKLKLNSGKEVIPVRAEFTRKQTALRKTPSINFRKAPTLGLPQNEEERVISMEAPITLIRPMEPIKLSSYVIAFIDFKYPNDDPPVGIVFDGFKDSDSNPLKPIKAELNKSVDYSYRGVANLFVGDLTPLEACRGLMEEQKRTKNLKPLKKRLSC